ncbi:hypothetical protein [Rhodococcus pyridinivorans]
MIETVTRFRSDGGWDENGDPIIVENPELVLTPLVIAPGPTNEIDALGRDGEQVEFTVFFRHGEDIRDGDDLEIRGRFFTGVRVREHRIQGSDFGGIEVVATSRVG